MQVGKYRRFRQTKNRKHEVFCEPDEPFEPDEDEEEVLTEAELTEIYIAERQIIGNGTEGTHN